MTSSDAAQPPVNTTYISDAASAAEMGRLLQQDRLLTEMMGGLLAELAVETVAQIGSVLDIACGPGGWLLDMAFSCPEKRLVGIDTSELMIAYAQTQAQTQKLQNVEFLQMDALSPLSFADSSFDLVNGRLLSSFVPGEAWPGVLRECLRVLRPGGIIRLTEFEFGQSNSPAYEQMTALGIQAMHQGGLGFPTSHRNLGVLAVLGQMMQESGALVIGRKAHVVDHSYGDPSHEVWYRDLTQIWKLAKPYILRQCTISSEEFDQIYLQMQNEMRSERFCALRFFLTLWGRKSD